MPPTVRGRRRNVQRPRCFPQCGSLLDQANELEASAKSEPASTVLHVRVLLWLRVVEDPQPQDGPGRPLSCSPRAWATHLAGAEVRRAAARAAAAVPTEH